MIFLKTNHKCGVIVESKFTKISFQIKKNSKHLDLIHVNIGDLKLMKTRSRKIIPLYI
jgi:hypothetical protein